MIYDMFADRNTVLFRTNLDHMKNVILCNVICADLFPLEGIRSLFMCHNTLMLVLGFAFTLCFIFSPGFRNTSSQISASVAPNGKYVVCASEDSHVYVWRHDNSSHPSRSRSAVDVTNSYEHFHCRDVTVAITWPGAEARGSLGCRSSRHSDSDGAVNSVPETPIRNNEHGSNGTAHSHRYTESPVCEGGASTSTSNHPVEAASPSLPDDQLPSAKSSPGHSSSDLCIGAMDVQRRSAWGLVIVTAGQGGEIRVFQNFGFPVQV